MKQITNYLSLIILLTVFSCSQNPDNAKMEMAKEANATTSEQKTDKTVERKLIKEGEIAFETNDLSTTRKTIFDAVEKHKGYVSSDREFKSQGRNSNTIIIRVPADHFDNLLKDASQGVEKFKRKEINVKDVTEEFLDIQARLKTKKELENRFIDLLKQAKNVTEILEIEKQIGELRSDIESTEGRLNYLQNRVSFSTLTITFYENIPNQTKVGEKLKDGFRNGWDNLIWFFVILVNIWPFILIGLGLIIGYKVYRKKR